MVWVKVDDRLHSHPKVGELDPKLMLECMGLNLLALSWCGEKLTDGILPKGQPARLAGRPVENLIAELVRVGLWERCPQGIQIHDFLDYNPTAKEAADLSRARADAGRRGAQARWQSGANGKPHGKSHTQGDLESMANLMANPMANAMAKVQETPVLPLANVWQNDAPNPSSIEDKNSGGKLPVDNSASSDDSDFRDIDFGEDES